MVDAGTENNDKVSNDVVKLREQLKVIEEEKRRLLEEMQKLQVSSSRTALRQSTKDEEQSTNHIENNVNTQKNVALPTSSQIQSSSSSKKTETLLYEKRKGVIDHGKEYEIIMCALYALRFGTNDDVVDFRMTTNNNLCGDFDDIEIEATFRNQKRCTYLFQLKHKDNKDRITQEMLTKEFLQRKKKQEKSKFYLPNYLKSISSFKMRNRDIIFILYTNSEADIVNSPKLSFKSYPSLTAETCNDIEYQELLITSDPKFIFRFKPDGDNPEEVAAVAETCRRFFFFTNQDNFKTAKTSVKEQLSSLLKSDIFDSFEHFMREWWSNNFILTKHGLITKLTEFVLSPYIKTISAEKHSQKTRILAEAVMRFELTIVTDDKEEIVKNIWPQIEEDRDWNSPMLQATENTLCNFQKSKFLWNLGVVPLIVKVEDSNKETVKCIMQLLRKNLGNKRILLLGAVSKHDFEEWITFETTSDLIRECGNEELCHQLMNTLKISFQGREPISLEQLLSIDKDFAEVIQTQELFEMTKKSDLCLGNLKEQLPDLLMPRIVSVTSASINEILTYEIVKNSVVIINCDTTFKEKLIASGKRNIVEVSDYLSERNVQNYSDFILLCSSHRCTSSQFDEVCETSKNPNVYVFQLVNDEKCVLLLKKGNQSLFENSFMKEEIEEKHILRLFDNPLNVFCAPPGMGKSTLMKVLNNSCPSNSWAIFVDLINYNSFLALNSDVETIWSKFLQLDDSQEHVLTKQTRLILWKNRKIQIFLDGLDEVDSKYLHRVIDFVKYASVKGATVWISSRDNLRERISQTLNVIPIEIKEFDEDQQKKYIHKKLTNRFRSEQIETIVTAVFNSADINSSRELLGIPLQLHILTETFLNNEEAFENLQQQNIFMLTQMYKLFFEGKKKTALKKIGVDEFQESQLGFDFEHQLEQYQIPALQSCLDEADFDKLRLNVEITKRFIKQIKTNGDKHAIIKKIGDNDEAVFDHQTYAEYFACLWFKKNKDKIVSLRGTIFSEKYENLRLIFDIMLAENNPLHLSVIYKNLEQFNKHLHEVEQKDEGGRTVLHLACSYGMKYPTISRKLDRETIFYATIMETLMHEDVVITTTDAIFKYDYLMYAVESTCVYPLEKMLEKGLVTFDILKEKLSKHYDNETLAFYSAQLGYPHLLSEIIKNNPEFVNKEICEEYLLQTAVTGSRSDTYKSRRPGNVIAARTLVAYGANINQILKQNYFKRETINILDFVCQNRWYDMFKLLVENGAKCIEGNSILHRICQYHTIDDEVLEILEDFDIDVNVRNDDGVTALHLVCETGYVESLKKLLQKQIDLNICDNEGNNAMHFACQALKENTEIVDLLANHGIKVNAQNKSGTTPLQLACLNNHGGIVKTLLCKEASGNICDNSGKNALFYACQSRKETIQIVELLVDHGIAINAQSNNGVTPLHIACKNGHAEIVAELLEKDADPNIFDNDKKNALHFACLSLKQNTKIVELLLSRDIDIDSQNKSGTTALQFACKSGYADIAANLLKRGTDLNLVDCNGQNALHYAYQSLKENSKVVHLLIDYGIDVNMPNKSRMSALHLACLHGQIEIVKKLMEKLVSKNTVDNDERNALHFVCQSNRENLEIINLLVDGGVDVNVRNKRGEIPLHLACLNGHLQTVKKLLEVGIVDMVDNDGRNALHFACQSRSEQIEIVDSLLTNCFDINARNVSGIMPLHLSCEMGHVNIVKKLRDTGADVNSVSNDEKNALHFACQSLKDNSIVIDLLIKFGLDVNSQNKFGATPLHLVCQTGQILNAKRLLEAKPTVGVVDHDNRSAMDLAHQIWGEHSEISNLLRHYCSALTVTKT